MMTTQREIEIISLEQKFQHTTACRHTGGDSISLAKQPTLSMHQYEL